MLTILAQIAPEGAEMTTTAILLAGLAVCGTVIAVLWKKNEASFMTLQKRADECDQDRARLWRALAENGVHHVDPSVAGER